MRRLSTFIIVAIGLFSVFTLVGCSHEHTYGDWAIETIADCETEGTMVRVCTKCGEKDYQVIPAIGHTYVKDNGTLPTCTEVGYTKGVHCSVCNKVLVEQKEIAVLAHNYGDWTISTAATCTTAGERLHVCVDCEYEENEEIPATGHIYVKDDGTIPTCTEVGYTEGVHCSVCNTVLVEKKEISVLAHNYGDWTVSTAATCTTAGKRVHVCEDCEHEEKEVIPATGHTYVKDDAVDSTCTKTGLTEGAHCSVCKVVLAEQKVVPVVEHSYGDWTISTAATCITAGEKVRVCEECEHEDKEEILATGHNYGDWTILTAITCTTAGEKVRVCEDCEHEDSEAIPANGHDYVVDEGFAASCTKTGLTDGAYCSECDVVLVKKSVIALLPHIPVVDEAVAPTMETTGLTEGSHCKVCDTVLVEQQIVPKLTEADLSYTVTFSCGDGITIKVHNIQDFSDEGYITTVGYSRGKKGELLKDGEGQINFEVIVGYGYKLKKVSVTPSSGFKNLKDSSEIGVQNGYRVTKITADITITVSSEIETSDFPAMIIHTQDYLPITSKEEYIGCTVSVINAETMLSAEYNFEDEGAKIRGRGNSTWGQPKNPYKLKFDSKTNLFGNGKAKAWTLIANYYDPSLIRNYLAYSVGALFDTQQYTTTIQFVDLYLNNEYVGVYTICEQVETGDNRVDISNDPSKYSPEDIGYLLEMDLRLIYVPDDSEISFRKGDEMYVIKSPEAEDAGFDETYISYIDQYFEDCYDALASDDWDEVCLYLDVESFAENYIINELFKYTDVGYTSFFLHKKGNGKLYCGPMWDYDISMGNYNHKAAGTEYGTDILYAANNNFWFKNLLKYEEFKNLVSIRLAEHAEEIEQKIDECSDRVLLLADSFKRNFDVYPLLISPRDWFYSDEMTELSTWEEQVEYVRGWSKSSLSYITDVYS